MAETAFVKKGSWPIAPASTFRVGLKMPVNSVDKLEHKKPNTTFMSVGSGNAHDPPVANKKPGLEYRALIEEEVTLDQVTDGLKKKSMFLIVLVGDPYSSAAKPSISWPPFSQLTK